jgi:hypothetical protein
VVDATKQRRTKVTEQGKLKKGIEEKAQATMDEKELIGLLALTEDISGARN